ncbi:MAG: SDR family oxidoreductase [Gemmatimonadales bacterium]|nr:SDR family oxidoreductase [Gemmatimonadales bacterium]
MSRSDMVELRRHFRGETVLITGSDGMLGRAFVEAFAELSEELRVIALPRRRLDVTDRSAVLRHEADAPTVILHCAGMALADACEIDPNEAFRVHVDGTANVCSLAHATSARLFFPQSVFIFDGSIVPVDESTMPNPQMVYGRAKLQAEQCVLDEAPQGLSVRMAGFFGGDEKDKNFVGHFTRSLAALLDAGISECEVGGRRWQPTYTLDHARNVLLLLARSCSGIYHMGSPGEASFHDVATACVEALGLTDQVRVLLRIDGESYHEAALRPDRMVTATTRLDREGLNRQRHWRNALGEYLERPHFDQFRPPSRRFK